MADEFQEVNVPGHGTFRFPAGMTREQMEPLLKARIGEPPTQAGQSLRQPLGRPDIGRELGSAVTDLPGEIARTTREQWDTTKQHFSDAGAQQNRGEGFFDIPAMLRPFLKTGAGLASGAMLPLAPAQGAARSLIGHPLAAGDELLRRGATKLHGEDKVPPGLGYEGARPLADEFFGLVGGRGGMGAFAGGTGSLRQLGKDALKPLEKILSPTTVSPIAGEAEAALRSSGGRAARDTATTQAAMEPFHRTVNALPEPDRLAFMGYVEGRSTGATIRDPALQPLADTMRTAFEQRKTKLQNLPSTAQAQFVEDYYPHHFEDPTKARAFGQNFGGTSHQGSGASLKKRTMPTIADGIAAGLKPVTTDPIEATLRYVASMDRFIASTEVLDAAKQAGTVKYIQPKTMGASGHPDSFKVPEGWVPIEGRGATNATGARAYAPADWARVYNNFISKGFHANEDVGKVYDALQSTSNAITALELGLSGYHAFTMANEAVISQVAKGISQIVGGKPIRALGTIASAPLAPVTSALKGHKFEQIYLGRTPGTPDWRRVVDLGTEAGMRAVGKGHAPDYRFSAMGSYWTAFRRGALKQEMQQSGRNIFDRPLVGTIKEAGKLIGRSLETVAQPLFEKYIPKIKNGAFYDTMQGWIEQNPQATHEQSVVAARKIWDSIDNRFGEMVQDNIFWNKTLKQASQLAMRSYSWNLGTVREIAGGAKDLATGQWTPRASYVVALPIVVGTVNAAYQYLKTGQAPESVDDLVAPRTGGTAPGFGGRGEVPERASLPGYQKDVLGWYHDWRQEAKNKLATGPRLAGELVAGTDWRGDPIARPDATVPQWLQDYFGHVATTLGPISVKQLVKGEKTGSALGMPSELMGIRPAPSHLQDPAGSERGQRAIAQKKWRTKERHDRNTKRQYGGPSE